MTGFEWLTGDDWTLTIIDGGYYGCGFFCKLPSGWCQVEIAVHYGDRR